MKLWQSKYNPQHKLPQLDLLDISEEITQAYAPHKTQHQPELVLMPVDPTNLYAYWKLKTSETENNISHAARQLALRVYTLPELSEHTGKLQLSFDINVHGLQNQQKIPLPVAASAYSAIIGEINADNSFSALATSEIIHVPREKPVTENSLYAPEIMERFAHSLENSMATEHTPDKSPETENSQNDTFHPLQNSAIQDDTYTHVAAHENTWSEPLILKNYNNYGYDLKVFDNNSSLEFDAILPPIANTLQMLPNITNISISNTSGLGRLI